MLMLRITPPLLPMEDHPSTFFLLFLSEKQQRLLADHQNAKHKHPSASYLR